MVVPHISRGLTILSMLSPTIWKPHHPTTSSSDADIVSELACKDTWDALFSDSESVLLS